MGSYALTVQAKKSSIERSAKVFAIRSIVSDASDPGTILHKLTETYFILRFRKNHSSGPYIDPYTAAFSQLNAAWNSLKLYRDEKQLMANTIYNAINVHCVLAWKNRDMAQQFLSMV